jgi:hypothetical protein
VKEEPAVKGKLGKEKPGKEKLGKEKPAAMRGGLDRFRVASPPA